MSFESEAEYLIGRFYGSAPRGWHVVEVKSDPGGRWIECECGTMWDIYLGADGRIAFDPVVSRECTLVGRS